MKPQKSTENPIARITSPSKDYKSVCSRIAIISSLNTVYAPIFNVGMLLIDSCQIIAQIYLLGYELSDYKDSSKLNLFATILSISKVFNPAALIPLEKSKLLLEISIIFMCITFLKYVLFLYVIILAFKKEKKDNFLLRLWTGAYKMQGRVSFYLVTSFWIKTIQAYSPNQLEFDKFSNIVIVVCATLTITEFLFSVLIGTHFTYILPSKDFLASKSYTLELSNLMYKFLMLIMQILLTSLPSGDPLIIAWCFTLINNIISILQDRYFFVTLPFYKLKALLLQACLMMVITCLNFAFLMEIFVRSITKDPTNTNFVVVLWLALTFLTILFVKPYLENIGFNLVIKWGKGSPELLLQKVSIIKDIIKQNQLPSKSSNKYSWNYFLATIMSANAEKVLGCQRFYSSNEHLGDIDPKMIKKQILVFLQKLRNKYPKNDLIRLFIGYYYIKKLKLYGPGVRILYDLKNSSSYRISLSASLIIHEAEKSISREYQNDKNPLQLWRYLKSLAFVNHLKEKMVKQADLLARLCQEINETAPVVSKIFNYGQQILKQKILIEKQIKSLLQIIPDYYLEPLMVCAHYYLTLNHSIEDYKLYRRTFVWKFHQYDKTNASDTLCEENLYRKDTHLVILSGRKGKEGTIINSTKSLDQRYGQVLHERHSNALSVPILREFFHEAVNARITQGDEALLSGVTSTFCYHSQGYIIPVSSYFNICPCLRQGLFYFIVLRPRSTKNDFILVSEKGNIEGFTKEIGERLGLLCAKAASREINLSLISEELNEVHKAFDVFEKPEKSKELHNHNKGDVEIYQTQELEIQSLNEKVELKENRATRYLIKADTNYDIGINLESLRAENLVSVFTTTGKIVELNPLRRVGKAEFSCDLEKQSLTYHCKIESQSYGPVKLKVITLEKVAKNKDYTSKANINKSASFKRRTLNLSSPLLLKLPSDKTEEREEQIPSEKYEKREIRDIQKTGLNENDTKDINPTTFRERNLQQTSVDYQTDMNGDVPPSSQRQMIKSKPSEEPSPLLKKIPSNSKVPKKVINPKDIKTENLLEEIDEEESQQSNKQKDFSILKISKTFRNAINIKYYRYFYKILIGSLYLIFIGLFFNQILLNQIVESDISNFEGRKDVLRMAESRNDLLITVHRRARHIWTFSTGFLQDQDYNQGARASFLTVIVNDLQKLNQANEGLLRAASNLNEENRQKLFQQNVQVFETNYNEPNQTYLNLTSFQATDRILETAFRGISVAKRNYSASTPYFAIIIRNALNDLLLMTEAAADVFLQSLENQKKTTSSFIKLDLIISLCLLIIYLIGFGYTMLIEYKTAKQNMLAFLRIDPIGVKNVLEKVVEFKKIIQEEVHFEDVEGVDISEYYNQQKKAKTDGKTVSKAVFQQPNYDKTGKSFYFSFMKMTLLICAMAVLIIINFVLMSNLIDTLNQVLTKLHFSDRVKSNLNLVVTISLDIFAENSTTLTRNNDISSEFRTRIEDLASIRTKLPNILKNADLTYDPLIENILFKNPCALLIEYYSKSCEVLRVDAKNVGLVRFISDLESLLKDYMRGYRESDKSLSSLKKLFVEDYNKVVLPANSLGQLALLIAEHLDEEFKMTLINGQYQNTLLTYLICIFACVECVLIHFRVINKVKEADNMFKNVLGTLPPTLVLSNFILKSYLIKTSKGVLDSIRNKI